MPHPFDATLKSIVADHPGDFAAAFGLPTNETVKALNVDLSTITAATDVALGFGSPVHEIADLNFQSGPDANLPQRLLMYNTALNMREGVPVRSFLILLRKKADAPNLTGKLACGEGDFRVEFGYRVVRLWEEPVENYLRASVSVLPLTTLCKMQEGKPLPEALRDVVMEIHRRVTKEADHAEAVKLMTAAYVLTGLRVAKNDLASIYRGVGLMQESTAFDEAIEEGERRGGLKRSHDLLLRQGRKRFGPFDTAMETELKAITDLERLERLADAILTANSWQELLATP